MQFDLFKSRKFWVMVVGMVMMAAVNYIPELEENTTQLTDAVLIVISLVIGGYAAEDTVAAFKSGKRAAKYDK